MVKDMISGVVDTVAGVAVGINEGVENVVDMIPFIGEPFVDKFWDPATDFVGKIAIAPFKVLGLTKKFR